MSAAPRILFDLGHPAHWHLFRNAMADLKAAGAELAVLAHQKDCLHDLLRASGTAFHPVPRAGQSMANLAAAAGRALRLSLSLSRPRPFDLMVGTSISIGLASRLTGATSIVFEEDDAAVIPLFSLLAYGTAHHVATPRCLAPENYGSKHLTYPGCQELAYLHPRRYRPDPSIRAALGVGPDEKFFLVRLVALRAHHDAGHRGLGGEQAAAIVRRLSRHGPVFVSAEAGGQYAELGARPLPTPPDRVLDAMAEAHIVVGDSQTMVAEAAVLGTPALRCNTFVGRLSYLEELEHRYGLTVGVRPERFDDLCRTLDDWLSRPDLKRQWRRRRDAMLAECVDTTDWMLQRFAEILQRRRRARQGP